MRSRAGGIISEARSQDYDFDRLERAVADVVAALGRQRRENAVLRQELEQKNQRIRALDGKLLGANQRRQDIAKRIDELIARINQLDASFGDTDA
jgi:septal ring factor EnvC (AmiA/AmiB activator)